MNHAPRPEILRLEEALERVVSALAGGSPTFEPIRQIQEHVRQIMEDTGKRESLKRL